MVFVNLTYDVVVNTQFHKFYRRPFACVLCFYPYGGYRSVTPLDAARVNRTIFHNHSVHLQNPAPPHLVAALLCEYSTNTRQQDSLQPAPPAEALQHHMSRHTMHALCSR